MSRRIRPQHVAIAALYAVLAPSPGCSLFEQDELASLKAGVLDGPATTLPVAGVDAPPDIAPLLPGELQPPPLVPEGGLGVLGVVPMGEDVSPAQVAVVFDRPMVALDAIEATSAAVPVRCTPSIAGRGRWAGTTTAVVVPDAGALPPATRYRCEVPAGTTAADGTALEAGVAWEFTTLRPALERSRPREGTTEWNPSAPLLLRFNQPVEPSAIQSTARLTRDDGGQVPFRANRGKDKEDRPDVVLLTAELVPDTGYTLTLPAGIRAAQGDLGSAAEQEVRFRTYPPLRVETARPEGAQVSPLDPLELQFSTQVDAAEVARRLHISPAPPDGFQPAEAYESTWWSWWSRLAPRTTYTVTLDPGLVDTHGQRLDTGHTWSFTTGDLPAMLDAPEGTQLYPASNPLSLPVRHRNVSALDVRLDPVDPRAIAYGAAELPGYERLPASQRLTPVATPNRVAVTTIDLSPALSPGGHGLVRLQVSAPEIRAWNDEEQPSVALLQVTDLGAALKLGPDGALVWVTRLSDGTPVGEADVEIVRGGRKVWAGRTGVDGVAAASGDLVPDDWSSWRDPLWVLVSSGDDTSLTSHRWDDGLEGWSHGVSSEFDPREQSLHTAVFTDRGVYRPGDTAHVQLTVRQGSLAGLAVPGPQKLKWSLSDPTGRSVSSGEGTTDTYGTWTVDLPLPSGGALGDHALEISVGEARSWTAIPVKAYRAPAFRVDVTSPSTLFAGGALSASIEGRYLFGAPMRGADLRWLVGREPLVLAPPGWEEFSFDMLPDMDAGASPRGWESVSRAEATLDDAGRFVLSQPLPATSVQRPWTYEVEATITDLDRQQLTGRSRVDVHVADAYPGVQVRGGLGTAGAPVEVRFAAVTPSGEPRSGTTVRLTAIRRSWDVVRERGLDGTWRWVNTAKDEVVAATTARTGPDAGTWSFTPVEGGFHVLRAEADGLGGTPVRAESSVYVTGGDVTWARSDTRTLELVPDKTRYAPGETARVLVKAPRAGMHALLTVEREGVWTRTPLSLTTTTQVLEIPLDARMVPNAFVSVLAVEGAPPATAPGAGKPGVWYGVTELGVSADDARLQVTLSADRPSYQPGDEVEIQVEARRGGKAAADASVTLWAVDHGVLSLTGYTTPDLHGAFYRPRPLGVLTADNRISVYDRAHYLSKGAEPGGGGGADGEGVRRRFETTPLWTRLRTDASGRLVHRFRLPDDLTTFRVMAVVQDKGAAFGSGAHELRVNRPLIARPALPRFFREGDKAFAGVVLHNNTDSALDVKVDARADGAALKGAPRAVRAAAGAAVEVPFAITDLRGPSVKLRFEAEAGVYSDTVEVNVPVSSPLPQEVVATSGSTLDTATEQVSIPSGAVRTVGALTVDVSASALVGMGSAVDYLLAYPHGCLEQVGSRTRAALLARSVREQAGISTSPEALDTYVRVGLSSLDGFRTPDGGYGYWPGGQASGLASAYALELLAEATHAGEPVDPRRLDELTTFVRSFLSGNHVPRWWTPEVTRAAQARAALALARAGRGDPGFNARLWDDRTMLPVVARAELLETLARTTGADARTRSLSQDLANALKIEPTRAALVQSDRESWGALWYGEDLGTTSLIRAWMAGDPGHPLLERLVRHLVGARRHGRWANTYSTAEALAALVAYVERHERGAVHATVTLAGAPLLDQALGVGGHARTVTPMSALHPGPLTLLSRGGRLYYEARLAYAQPILPPRDEGFTLTRTYEILEGTGSGDQVSPGAVVRVTLRVVTPIDRYNVALVDHLPAGLEPVDTTFATRARDDRAGGDTGGWEPVDTGLLADPPTRASVSTWTFNRRELGDDHVSVYADHMPAGIHVTTYLARATTPGDYAHPAATVEDMYAPDVFGRTDAGRFVVGWPVAQR